ncbi:molybdenum cofactor guanylyltransferase MobA [Elongatibacter sediminis]|uniref:Molybdenum cofactor guanylyltransferase n=1 Tax=Elongatibacter sediminis TaxID=3119006 RepID=A0AAW9R651_9GAMM
MSGVILAGGRARRMGGCGKALLSLSGKPLLGHVIERLAPQVDGLVLSVECRDENLERFGLEQVPDPNPGGGGPLGGLLAALSCLPEGSDWLLLAPCDAPFLPPDLGSRLLRSAVEQSRPGALARYQGELQPTFSLWHRSLEPEIRRAVVERGLGGFKQFLDLVPLPAVDWPESDPPPFFNINTPEALERAEALLRRHSDRM